MYPPASTQVPFDELVCAAASLVEALSLRREYMELSGQSISPDVLKYLSNKSTLYRTPERDSMGLDSRMLRVDSSLNYNLELFSPFAKN